MKKILLITIMLVGFLTTYAQQCTDGDCQNVPISRTQGWSNSHGSPSWGSNSVWLWSYRSGNITGEGVNYSGHNFVQGEEYCVSFTLAAGTNTPTPAPNQNCAMNVFLTQGTIIGGQTPGGGNPIPANSAINQQIMSQNIWSNGNNTNTYQFTFVAANNFDNIWFYPSNPARPNPQIDVTISDVNICHITCEDNQDVAFHFEHENGTQDTEFNLCEDVYLNAAATLNTGNYFIDLWRVNGNGTLSWISKQSNSGWVTGSLNAPINITDVFKNNGVPNVTFQAGTTYEVKLAINHPQCGWSFETHRFTYKEATMSSNFTLDYYCHDGVYDVTVTAVDTDPNQWWMLLETNTQGVISDASTIGQASGIQGGTTTTFTNLDPNKFYYVKHGVWTTNCPWQETRIALDRDCCIDNPEIFPYCEDPCVLDSFPLKVKDKNGDIITSLSGATFNWTNTITNTTSTNDIVVATDADHWKLTLTMPDGCIYNVEYELSCCNDDIHLEAYKCPTESDVEVLKSQLENKEIKIDEKNYKKHVEFLNTYTSRAESCDPCDTGLFIIRVLDADGNLATNFNTITWNDGLYANQNIRWGNVNTLYSVTVTAPSSNGKEVCTYKDEIIYECETACEGLSAPIHLKDNGSTLSWDPVPGAVSYIVSSPSKINVKCCVEGISIAPIQTTTNYVTLSGKLKASCFVWQVIAVCADGTQSEASKQMCHNPNVLISIDDQIEVTKHIEEEISIYPNPSRGALTIKLNLKDTEGVILNIHRFDGTLIKTINTIEIDKESLAFNFQSDLPRGRYLFNFITSNGTTTKQVIIE